MRRTWFGGGSGAVSEYGLGVDALGYEHTLAYDHVVGAARAVRPDFVGPSNVTTFRELFVSFGYLGAITDLELVTGTIARTTLVHPPVAPVGARRRAACGGRPHRGRFRLGVTVSWGETDFEGFGKSVTDRRRRIDEQIRLMRRLWEPTVVDAVVV